jgi:hypothetical protein
LGHILENKTNLECNQNLPRLFGTACRLTWPVAATWRAFDYRAISQSRSECLRESAVARTATCSLLEQIKNLLPNTSHRQLVEVTGMPNATIACSVQQQEKLAIEWISRDGEQGEMEACRC